MKPETVFRQNQVIPFLKALKHSVFHPIQQKAICGDADFFGCVRGLFVALELKSKGGKLAALQAHKLSEIQRCGGIALVASPENWHCIREQLLKLDGGLR